MAHSIQICGQKSEVINDLDLLVIVGFAVTEICQSQQFHSLEKLASRWKMVADQYGPGMIDLELEQLIENDSTRKELTAVLNLALQNIHGYGEFIPGAFLNANMPVPGVIFHNFDTTSLRDAIKRLQALIESS